MLRMFSSSCVGALAVSLGCGLGQEPPEVEGRGDEVTVARDGTVTVGHRVYSDIHAFHGSSEFREGGRRCATPRPSPEEIASLAASDCSLTATTIRSEYDPGVVYEIPVVFHIIERNSGTGYIPDSLVQSQVDVLNEDFRALFGSLGQAGDDSRIQFVLATVDPDGMPTTGILHYIDNGWYQDPGPGVFNNMKAAIAWEPARYFNIYTNDGSGGGTLGYATFPQLSAGSYDDGVVLNWQNVGRDAPTGGSFNLGRTATHEVGHYLGLFHTFEGGCGDASWPYNTGDLISDTVAEQAPQFGCMPGPSACGSGNNPIENYMDYTDDLCMTNFTVEQINRMRCALAYYRPSLLRISGAPVAEFTHVVNGTSAEFMDRSTDADGSIAAWAWDFGDGSAPSSAQNPAHTFAAVGTYEVSLTVTDDSGNSHTVVHEIAIMVPPTAAFSYTAQGLGVTFTDESTDPDGTIVSWQWSFGDGAASSEQAPTHTYETAGTYTVALTVTDNTGNAGSATMDIMVSDAAADAGLPDASPTPDGGVPDDDGGGCGCSADHGRGSHSWPGMALLLCMVLWALNRPRARSRKR